ncbi:MAG: DUF2891 domain-containing protein [Lewinellaceae bacterium]|nr:DUF2891 domain-containing protein [Phaeodactylibacter sp.]MCB0615015.1 DUF2891 domain-containing protein [Phaeodactylibacter sp.]MCB9349497.1 DUF2891 domain-containing protein [Lewinellaceae bacterium]
MKYLFVSTIVLLLSSCSPQTPKQMPAPQQNIPDVRLNQEQASRLSQLAFNCIGQPYPNKLGQVLGDSTYLAEPRALHPAFYGCFDWHSAVHGHWSLVRLLKTFPDMPQATEIRALLSQNLTQENIRQEVAFFDDEFNKNFERTYGWAWVLKLAEELQTWDDPQGKQWREAIRPLENLVVQKFIEFLPKLTYPIRVGEHSNTAFALAFAWDYAVATERWELQELVAFRARDFYFKDQGCPISWEPSGFDFLSPCLEEADIMSRVLDPREFQDWFAKFLPNWQVMTPAEVSDRTDGKLVHLDGLNFSRAWVLYSIAQKLPGQKEQLSALAAQHMAKSLPQITSGDYAGEHWLASFALYALSAKDKLK